MLAEVTLLLLQTARIISLAIIINNITIIMRYQVLFELTLYLLFYGFCLYALLTPSLSQKIGHI